MSNLERWDKLAKPPKEALKTIKGGRLAGMTDINPQWRYKAMTEVYGPCGTGWNYQIEKLWTEKHDDGQVSVSAQIVLEVLQQDQTPLGSTEKLCRIPGIGGSMLVVMEKAGLRVNDEAYKMAITDALSVAMKMLGVGADIYMGRYDGSKYADEKPLAAPILPTDGALEDHQEGENASVGDDEVQALSARLIMLYDKQDWDGVRKEAMAANLSNADMIKLWAILTLTRNHVKAVIKNPNLKPKPKEPARAET